ncbi:MULTISPECIES: LysR family transcriptional regulator [Arthrobacter]|uniref:LysR family transcriptional regulator n=1 Tax=Arthrobacter terricola TaxID=2547396 RepID=A0A4R5K752_9MICC|nr:MULTISPECIES: LysR family transcriptional regulator [Arthrobacter]MBT8163663.1 LysR family transcriptional regulator [Arthrobacter sp. GN70]TDF87878.1 LysR family transcriptional regulator [Arthrobacter terricola]
MRWVKGNLNIINLRTLQMVINTGSHTGAAKKLGYTTSAVSQQIAALEKALGVELFERGPRSLWPTPAGLAMSAHADVILRQVARAEDEMQAYASGSQGSLRIGASGTAAAQLVPRALSRLAMRYATADISVEDISLQKGLATSVLEGLTDLGIIYEYGRVPIPRLEGLVLQPILDEELVVISAAHSAGKTGDKVPLEEFAQENWITNEVGSAGAENFIQMCEQAGFEPNIGFHSNDFDVIRGLVKETIGVALVPALALGIDRGIAFHRLLDPPRRTVHVAHRASDLNPLLGVTIAALREAAEDFIDWTKDAFEVHLDNPVAFIVGD